MFVERIKEEAIQKQSIKQGVCTIHRCFSGGSGLLPRTLAQTNAQKEFVLFASQQYPYTSS